MKAKSYDREKNIKAREVTKSKRELQHYRQKEKKAGSYQRQIGQHIKRRNHRTNRAVI